MSRYGVKKAHDGEIFLKKGRKCGRFAKSVTSKLRNCPFFGLVNGKKTEPLPIT